MKEKTGQKHRSKIASLPDVKEYYERTKNSGPDRLTFKPFSWMPADPKPGAPDWVQVPRPSPTLSLSLPQPASLTLEPRGNGLRIAVIGSVFPLFLRFQ